MRFYAQQISSYNGQRSSLTSCTTLFHPSCHCRATYDNLIFALKKFTGGMGDEDEEQPGDNKTWWVGEGKGGGGEILSCMQTSETVACFSSLRMDYFLRPVSSTTRIICTQKANGEAAHLSARYIKDR